MIIYIPWNHGLGDHIATIQLLAHRGAATGQAQMLSCHRDGQNFKNRMEQLIRALNIPPNLLMLIDGPGDTALSGFDVWATPFTPTLQTWYWRGSHKHVTVHFNGISSPEKNPPPADQERILRHINSLGYEWKVLTNDKSIAECVELLADSAFFIGCDSGFSHLAHCTKTPIFLLQYGLPVVTCHRGKEYILCEGAGDLIDRKLPTWLHCRKFIGL